MTTQQRSAFRCEVYDKYEGRITIVVQAHDEDEAEWEANLAASERGCSFVEEVEVYKVSEG